MCVEISHSAGVKKENETADRVFLESIYCGLSKFSDSGWQFMFKKNTAKEKNRSWDKAMENKFRVNPCFYPGF